MIDFHAIMLVCSSIFIYMNLLFILALVLKKNDIVDIAWGLGFILTTGLLLILVPGYHLRRIIVSTLVLTWGFRLAIYIFLRNKGKKEDFRYAQWKKDWGKHWIIRSYLQVFILQGFFMLTIAYPLFLHTQNQPSTINYLDIIGILLWLTGFFFEAVGDTQMHLFKRDPPQQR